MKLSIFIFLSFLARTCVAQLTTKDTILYLFFDKGKLEIKRSGNNVMRTYSNGISYKIEHTEGYHTGENKIVNPENFYTYREPYYLYGGHPIEFHTLNKANSRSIKKNNLKKINVVTIDLLKSFLESSYTERKPEEYLPLGFSPSDFGSFGPDPNGSASYWNQLRHIFIVERDDKVKNKFTLTEVRFDVDIE